MPPSSYVQIVDNDESVVDDNKAGGAPPQSQQQQTTCLDEATCPFIQQRPHSSSSMEYQNQQQQTLKQHRRRLGSFNISKTTTGGGSQSTLNTLCSSSRKSREQQVHYQNAVYNRLYHSDPSTHMLGTHSHVTDESNYAHIKHSHRHPHFHLRRQSQPDETLRLMSRNSSSVKSFTSQCYINPEYFYEIRPSRSCDDSKASLIPRKPSQNQIMLLNSELHLLEGLHGEHSHSYPKINYLERRYLLDDDVDGEEIERNGEVHLQLTNGDDEYTGEEEDEEVISSSESERSDASEFHENKTSTLDRKRTLEIGSCKKSPKIATAHHKPPPPPPIPMFSETDSYSTVNDEITQLVSKHLSNSIKQLVAQRLADIESYTLPLRRRHSCDSSSLSDIVIPELFNSPSRIKWNFLTGLPDRSRSQSQIYSSDYKTEDEDDDEAECDSNGEEEEEEIESGRKSSSLDYRYRQQQLMHELQHHHQQHKTIWRTSSHGSSSNTTSTLHHHQRQRNDAIMFHHDNNELVENFCATHFMRPPPYGAMTTTTTSRSTHSDDTKHDEKEEGECDDDARVFEFQLCTKENCEYLSKSQMPVNLDDKNLLNNEKLPEGAGGSNQKNINLKHNKFNKKAKKSKKGKMKENREQSGGVADESSLMWNKINLNHLMKKESNINSVNLKPHSSSSSTSSVNHNNVGSHRRNLKRHQKACDKLFTTTSLSQRQQQSLNVTSLILATSSNSTQARIRNDGGIYFSNPDLSSIPVDLRSLHLANSNNITSNINNNSCQYINNDLRGNSNTVNNSRSRFDSRFNNSNSATNYLLESINSNNIDNSNNSSDELMQQQDLRRRLRYINLHGMVRRAQRRAKKYLNSLTFASRK